MSEVIGQETTLVDDEAKYLKNFLEGNSNFKDAYNTLTTVVMPDALYDGITQNTQNQNKETIHSIFMEVLKTISDNVDDFKSKMDTTSSLIIDSEDDPIIKSDIDKNKTPFYMMPNSIRINEKYYGKHDKLIDIFNDLL